MVSSDSKKIKSRTRLLVDLMLNITEDIDDIRDVMVSLRAVDWDKARKEFEKKSKKICPSCGKIFSGKASFCPNCNSEWNKTELRIIQSQNRRAINRNAKGVLSFREWMKTLNDFHHKCAYCQKAGYEVLEHFVPIGAEGGDTAAWNCVPACYRCNWLKKGRNPYRTRNMRIPKPDIDRVKDYLNNKKEENL